MLRCMCCCGCVLCFVSYSCVFGVLFMCCVASVLLVRVCALCVSVCCVSLCVLLGSDLAESGLECEKGRNMELKERVREVSERNESLSQNYVELVVKNTTLEGEIAEL